jgi:hypothetical protein
MQVVELTLRTTFDGRRRILEVGRQTFTAKAGSDNVEP